MGDSGIAALLVRTLLSLTVVLAIVGVAYLIARRRAGGSTTSRPRSTGRSGRRARRAPHALEVVGRVGLSRSSALVAVRFGDRIVLVAAGEGAPASVVTEMTAEHWDELHTVREAIDPTELHTLRDAIDPTDPTELLGASVPASPAALDGVKPGFVEALRQATARYG